MTAGSALDFDKVYWASAISRPDWYFEFVDWAEKAQDLLGADSEQANQLRRDIRHFFEDKLKEGKVALANTGPNWDQQRLPVDTVVIHHTSAEPGYRLSYMNAVQLLNIYATHYANSKDGINKRFPGQPVSSAKAIWSGHFRGDKPSFLCYHWLMRMDGKFERLLDDDLIGWHAGNWDINRPSVAICLDNDFDARCPAEKTLKQLASHIKNHYPRVKKNRIIGHCEARVGTTCPGKHFVDEWKPKLLELI
jgi:hypothetical protein